MNQEMVLLASAKKGKTEDNEEGEDGVSSESSEAPVVKRNTATPQSERAHR